jgi:hypothetical protein
MVDKASIHGQARTHLGIRSLARRLRDAGVAAEVRESCHYTGGRYLSVFVGEAEFWMERVTADEYLIVDFDPPDAATLRRAAARLSRALADLEVRHRFEIEDGGDEVTDYLHHDWPA